MRLADPAAFQVAQRARRQPSAFGEFGLRQSGGFPLPPQPQARRLGVIAILGHGAS
jgi:hypothetical protein